MFIMLDVLVNTLDWVVC